MRRTICLELALLMLGIPTASGQVSVSLMDFARPKLQWHTLATDHFVILYHEGPSGGSSERSAREVARIAESVYGPITELYDYEPAGKVRIILKDYEDYANGAAYFYDNKIEIWAPALDSPLRGDHAWLHNVVAHEFTHIVQVQASMKMSRSVPFAYLQILDYEDVRRPDVLYGFPNVIVSYPLAGLSNPAWLAEGTAQYQRSFMDYDRWDTHRDMLLRTRVLAGHPLTLAEMGSFYSKSSLMREGVYNHGFAFTHYLVEEYGEPVLARLTRALGQWRHWNIERALATVTGIAATDVYRAWMESLIDAYTEATAPVVRSLREGELIEERGHANYYPAFAPDGARLAYVSSGDRHYGQTSLYVRDLAAGTSWSHDLGPSLPDHTCALGHRLRRSVAGPVTWHPDGQHIVYVRRRPTAEGYLYNDLYEISTEDRKEVRLTHDERATHPAYAPDGRQIAFVRQEDGTTNLMVLDRPSGTVSRVTSFDDGTQVSEPTWQGDSIVFALLPPKAHGRDLWRVRADGTDLESVVATSADERSPAVWGEHLYYSSDAAGIFNIYRFREGQTEQLTQVLGGAFMPDVRQDGTIAYAHYRWDGYKVALLTTPTAVPHPARYEMPAFAPAAETSLEAAPPAAQVQVADSAQRYVADFTDFSFFPVLRFDQYVSRRSSRMDRRLPDRSRAGTLLRNTKVGLYLSSREMLEGMRLFAGLMVGPASRTASSIGNAFAPSSLLELERDIFLMFDYARGISLLPGRWSPQISVELFNIRRRVEHGLSIEEFPCTACFPDTTYTDLTYALWEGSLYARSKVTPNLAIEAGYRYSPYRVVTDQFYSRELLQSVPKSSSRYFIGRTALLRVYFELLAAHRDADIFPVGLTVEAAYEQESGRLLDRFEIRNGFLVPLYRRDAFHRLRLDAVWGVHLPGRVRGAAHGATVRLFGSAILGKSRESFYNEYVGGLTAARGYPFYALGGSRALWVQASYTMPLLPNIGRQFFFTYLDKLHLRLYADAAAVWPQSGVLRRDMGAELRLKLGSHYLVPTALFASATYGLDAFDYVLDEDFVTPSGSRTVRYGHQWLWHFGILFGFDL